MKIKNALKSVGKEVIIKYFHPADRELEIEDMVYTIGKTGVVSQVIHLSHGDVKLKVDFDDNFWYYYPDVVKFKK